MRVIVVSSVLTLKCYLLVLGQDGERPTINLQLYVREFGRMQFLSSVCVIMAAILRYRPSTYMLININ